MCIRDSSCAWIGRWNPATSAVRTDVATSASNPLLNAYALASLVGIAAKQVSNAKLPLVVLSFASSASSSAFVVAPRSVRAIRKYQRRSASTFKPGALPFSSARMLAVCASVCALIAKAREISSCRSLPAAELFVSAHSPSANFSRAALRFASFVSVSYTHLTLPTKRIV